MTTTIKTLCQRSLKTLGVGGLNRTPTDRQVSAALDFLNEMMHGLNGKGAVVEWSDKGLNDTFPFEKDIEGLVIDALANRMQVPVGQFPTDRDLRRRLESAEMLLVGRFTPERAYDSGYF